MRLETHTPSAGAQRLFLQANLTLRHARAVEPALSQNIMFIVQPRRTPDDEGAMWVNPEYLRIGHFEHLIVLFEPPLGMDVEADAEAISNHADWIEEVRRTDPQAAVYVDDPVCGIARAAFGIRRQQHLIVHELAHVLTYERHGIDAASRHGPEWRGEFQRLCRLMRLTRDEIEHEAFTTLIHSNGLTDYFLSEVR
jgi:hypothetical protein